MDAAPVDSGSSAVTQWLTSASAFGKGLTVRFTTQVLGGGAAPLATSQFSPVNDWTPDCDTAPFFLPTDASVARAALACATGDEGCLLLLIDAAANRLYEIGGAHLVAGVPQGGCAAIWDLSRVYGPEGRGEQCTSADPAGFPIAPLLLTADEVAAGSVAHAVRFLLPVELARAGFYRHPGNHAGKPSGPDTAPVYGSRLRLRADFNLASLPSEGARTVARALQRYGMVLSEGWSAMIDAQSDRSTKAKWSHLLGANDLASLTPTDFEVLDTGAPIPLDYNCTRMSVAQ